MKTVPTACLFAMLLLSMRRLAVRALIQPRQHRVHLSPLRVLSSVDRDLDSALDSILGDVQQKQQGKANMAQRTELKMTDEALTVAANGASTINDNAVDDEGSVDDEGPVDYKDPAILRTSNPRWIQLGMESSVIDVLSNKGIDSFTPVQAEAFEPILNRRDVIGRSRTGTGKTLAFGIPAVHRIVQHTQDNGTRDRGRMQNGRPVSMVVLCPTRELARQVQEELAQVAKPFNLFSEVFHGGVSYNPQAGALRRGLDILVGTPGRIIDHMERGNLDLSYCDIAVLDEADEMLNMGFAQDVETILEGVGSKNDKKTQCLLFSATTPPWVKQIGRQYQENVLAIDSTTEEGGARVAKTVRHTAVQVPPGQDSKLSILEDIIAVEISRDKKIHEEEEIQESDNPIAAAAKAKAGKGNHAVQQKVFGKTIVFTETKRLADELVSGNVFKSLTAQALHGDVGQAQRDATLNAFRRGAFNVLVATDVAARGIDIKNVDLVVQFDPPRDADTYVHRSGRTGRAQQKGVSVLLFNRMQSRDIVKIERDLGHGFKFELIGPPSTEAALNAAAKTSAIACKSIPDEIASHFAESAEELLSQGDDPKDIVARCLAAISRRATEVTSRSLLTGEVGHVTVEMKDGSGRGISANDVMFTVNKISRMSQQSENGFKGTVGKIQTTRERDSAFFDMSMDDAKNLVTFAEGIDAGGATFHIVKEMEIERSHNFGLMDNRGRGGRGGGYRGGNSGYNRNGSSSGYKRNSYGGGSNRGGYQGRSQPRGGRYNEHDRDGGSGRRDSWGQGNRGRQENSRYSNSRGQGQQQRRYRPSNDEW